MNSVFLYAVAVFSVTSLLLLGIVVRFGKKSTQEKGSPFECGFDACGVTRLPFCMKFFLVSIIFLVFDVEVSLIFPIIYRDYQVFLFLLILLIGLLYEWIYGGLRWIV